MTAPVPAHEGDSLIPESMIPTRYEPDHRQMTPMEMLDRAIAAGANPEVLGQLMSLHERWEAREARKAFDEALAAAKAEIPVIRKNKHVGFESKKVGAAKTDYWHEDLAELARTVDPILSRNGLSYRFRTTSAPGQPVSVVCILSHRLGHSEENGLDAPKDESGNKNAIQAIGSTITYLQRYTLKAALGLAAARDDDGASAFTDETISEEQLATIRAAVDETEADISKFCQWLGVDALPDIRAADYRRAMGILSQKRDARKQQQAEGALA